MKKAKPFLLALVVMALWGLMYPSVKLGYQTMNIDRSSIADILMFAALRFAVCGAVLCGFCACRRKTIVPPKGKTLGYILLIGFFSVILHYSLYYVGLSLTDSSKTAILKQSASLLYVCFAFLFFKDESFSASKIIGAVVGFCGVVAINISASSWAFGLGEGLILIASVATVTANIISRKSVQNASPFWLTGISQLFGGIVLLFVALAMGGKLPDFNPKGTLVFTVMCVGTIASYVLWYNALKTCPLSRMFIIKFAEPIFACIFSAILLGENIFKLQYLIAFILISSGIMIGHIKKERKTV